MMPTIPGPPLKVYIAAPWVHKAEAREVAAWLRWCGVEITSRWLDFTGDADNIDVRRSEAEQDMMDVRASDVLVVLNLALSEGKATEQGLALAWGIPIIGMLGPANNVFHYLPNYTWVDSRAALLTELRAAQVRRNLRCVPVT